MTRREFMFGGAAVAGAAIAAGCAVPKGAAAATAPKAAAKGGRILFGACFGSEDKVALMKSVGYDFWEGNVGVAFNPDKDGEWWKAQRDRLAAYALPLRSCNCFLPGRFRLTGPEADHAPALAYAETAMRRADELGVKTLVFGSGGARNVPGDITAKDAALRPDTERGRDQYTEFCRALASRVADLKTTAVVVEPLRPKETNIVNFVWEGRQIVEGVGSPRVRLLADIFHMMMGREEADSIVKAGAVLKHCHIAEYGTRQYPGSDPAANGRYAPYLSALKEIGYAGGVSCECGWGDGKDIGRKLETALATLREYCG